MSRFVPKWQETCSPRPQSSLLVPKWQEMCGMGQAGGGMGRAGDGTGYERDADSGAEARGGVSHTPKQRAKS